MKKVYLLGMALMFAGAQSMAQKTTSTYNFGQRVIGNELDRMDPNHGVQTTNGGDRALNIVWTEDFNGSTGMTTANGVWTTEGPEAAYWTMGNDAHPLSSFGWTHNMPTEHLTWDSYNPNSAEGSFATTVVNGAIFSPAMDLSTAVNGAIVEFDLETMYCCNFQEFPWYMYVSSDNGVTWSAGIPMDYGVDRNVPTEDIAQPLTYSVDITPYMDAVPANNNDVRIKFSWEATNADSNGQINTHYFWMIDDIVVFEVPPFEIQNQRLWLGDIFNGWEYGDIDDSQAGLFTVQSEVKSIGSGVPTNLAQEVTVYDGTMTQIFTETGGALMNPPIAQGVTDLMTFTTTLDLATLTNGTYTVRVVTTYDEVDEVPSNDTLFRTFNKTANTISHIDYDQAVGRNYSSDVVMTETGAFFPIYNDVLLHGVDFYIRNGTSTTPSSTDIEVEVNIYEDNGTDILYVDGPYTFDVTAGMLDQWNTFNLYQAKYENYSPITLYAGGNYVVAVKAYGGEILWYQNNSIDDDNSGIFYHDGDGTWYLTGDEPWIALNFDQTLSIGNENEYSFSIGQNYPNPFDNNSVISYNLEEASNVSVEFTDLSGKVVMTVDKGTQAPGTYQIEVNSTEFAEGIYFYTFTVGDTKVTRKMTVTK